MRGPLACRGSLSDQLTDPFFRGFLLDSCVDHLKSTSDLKGLVLKTFIFDLQLHIAPRPAFWRIPSDVTLGAHGAALPHGVQGFGTRLLARGRPHGRREALKGPAGARRPAAEPLTAIQNDRKDGCKSHRKRDETREFHFDVQFGSQFGKHLVLEAPVARVLGYADSSATATLAAISLRSSSPRRLFLIFSQSTCSEPVQCLGTDVLQMSPEPHLFMLSASHLMASPR